MVQSARSQAIVKGDDVVLTHQIMGDVAFAAEQTRAPVTLSAGDTVSFFYPIQDSTQTDLIGYAGAPIGSFPTSKFTVPISGSLPAVGSVPTRGTQSFQSGPGRTVRAEITRLLESPTGNTTSGSAIIASISSMVGLVLGQSVVGAGIPQGSIIVALGSSQITISNPATATASGVSLAIGDKETHYLIDEVDIFERGFPSSLSDTSGGVNPPPSPLNLT